MTWHLLDSAEHPAPRDGTVILVGTVGGNVDFAYWSEYKVPRWQPCKEGFCRVTPTHWMPKPPPPKDEG